MIDGSSLRVAVQAHTEIGESPSWDDRCRGAPVRRRSPGHHLPLRPGRRVAHVVHGRAGGRRRRRARGRRHRRLPSGTGSACVDEDTRRARADRPDRARRAGQPHERREVRPGGPPLGGHDGPRSHPGRRLALPDPARPQLRGSSAISPAPTVSAGAPRGIGCTTSTRSRAASTSSTSSSRPARPRTAAGSPSFTPEEVPDGLAVDSEGHIWVALFGGGCIRRYAPGRTARGPARAAGEQADERCLRWRRSRRPLHHDRNHPVRARSHPGSNRTQARPSSAAPA